MSDDAADLDLISRAARAAGEEIMTRRGRLADSEIYAKAGGEPVSEADLAADRILRDILCDARPDYGWLSEESEDDRSRLDRKRVFVIDPIDGTRAYLKGQPHFTVSVAVVEDGRPVAGALLHPPQDDLYAARAGAGATLNGAPIRVDDREAIAGSRLVCPPDNVRGKRWRRPWPDMMVESRNSMAYRIAMVARGDWHGALALRPKSDWDLAAADIILREAGGVITDLAGRPFRYNEETTRNAGVVCGGPAFHAALMDQMNWLIRDEADE